MVFIASAAFYLIKPALALKLRDELHATALEVTALTSAFMAARALAAPLAGFAGDRTPGVRGKIARLALLPISVIALAYAFAPEAILAVLLSALHGFFSGILWPTLQVIVGFSAPEKKRGSYLGTYFTLGALGSSTGYALYGLLPLSSTQLILTGFVLYALSAVVAVLLFSSRTLSEYSPQSGGGTCLSSLPPLAIWIMGISFVTGGAMGLMNEYLYIFLREVQGMSRSELGYALTLATLLASLSGILSGLLADRFGIRRVLALTLLLLSGGLLSLAASTSTPAVVLSLALVLVAVKAALPLTRSIAVAGTSSRAGSVVGLSNTLSSAGAVVFPLAAGYVYDTFEVLAGLDARAAPLIFCSAAVFLLAALSPLAGRRKYSANPP